MMSVEGVAIFWVVNASSGEKSCLQFSIPTGSGAGGEGGVSHSLKLHCTAFVEGPEKLQKIRDGTDGAKVLVGF